MKYFFFFAFMVASLFVTRIVVAFATPDAPLTAEKKAEVERDVYDLLRDTKVADLTIRDMAQLRACRAQGF
jgi:hypothetical protein